MCVFCSSRHIFLLQYVSLLKIWNLNKYSGVIGVFNCQGAGSWPCLDSSILNDTNVELSGKVSPADIELFQEVCGESWTGDCAVFSFQEGMSTIFLSNIMHEYYD